MNNSKSILLNLHWKMGVVSVVGIHVTLKPNDTISEGQRSPKTNEAAFSYSPFSPSASPLLPTGC